MWALVASLTVAPARNGLRMDGTIEGSTYQGTTAFTDAASTPGAAAVGSARGDVFGGFYGAWAAEATESRVFRGRAGRRTAASRFRIVWSNTTVTFG